jgi:glycine cleavage system H protein
MSSESEHYPDDLLYHPEHDWVRIDGAIATFGVTWYAQDSLGEVIFWDAPQVGAKVVKDQGYAELESVKAVTEVVAPLSGEIVEINESLAGDPTLINRLPYDDGWLARARISDPSERDALLGAAAYRELL